MSFINHTPPVFSFVAVCVFHMVFFLDPQSFFVRVLLLATRFRFPCWNWGGLLADIANLETAEIICKLIVNCVIYILSKNICMLYYLNKNFDFGEMKFINKNKEQILWKQHGRF